MNGRRQFALPPFTMPPLRHDFFTHWPQFLRSKGIAKGSRAVFPDDEGRRIR
jgi:hypothetical protein